MGWVFNQELFVYKSLTEMEFRKIPARDAEFGQLLFGSSALIKLDGIKRVYRAIFACLRDDSDFGSKIVV